MDAWCCKHLNKSGSRAEALHVRSVFTGTLKHLEMWFLFSNLKAHLLTPRVGFARCNLCSFGKTHDAFVICLTFDPSVKMLSVVVSTLTRWKGHAHAGEKSSHIINTWQMHWYANWCLASSFAYIMLLPARLHLVTSKKSGRSLKGGDVHLPDCVRFKVGVEKGWGVKS